MRMGTIHGGFGRRGKASMAQHKLDGRVDLATGSDQILVQQPSNFLGQVSSLLVDNSRANGSL